MGRVTLNSFVVLALVIASPLVATAQRPHAAVRAAEALLEDSCELHSLLESHHADVYTIRSASRLESTVEQLIEKLSCPHSEAAIGMLMDECTLWYNRTLVAVRRDCRLDEDRAIASVLACAGRQLASLEDSIACFLRDSRRDAGHHSGHSGRNPRWDDPRVGRAPLPLPGQPGSWVGGPFGDPRGNSYPNGSGEYGHSGFAPGPSLRAQPGYGSGGFSLPAPAPAAGRGYPRTGDYDPRVPLGDQSSQGIGRSVLESVLSELARSR